MRVQFLRRNVMAEVFLLSVHQSVVRCAAFAAAVLCASSTLRAAVIFPVKEYDRPDEAVMVKFVNEKGDEGKKALEALGEDAGKLEGLYAPAAAAEIAGTDGTPAFKVFSASGEELKV